MNQIEELFNHYLRNIGRKYKHIPTTNKRTSITPGKEFCRSNKRMYEEERATNTNDCEAPPLYKLLNHHFLIGSISYVVDGARWNTRIL